MNKSFLKTIKIISLSQIDKEDSYFSTSPPSLSLNSLTKSIEEVGLLSPLHIQRRSDGGFRLVIGFRRYRAASRCGLIEVPCIIRNEKSDFELFVQAIQDNAATRSLHVLEKAQMLWKLRHTFSVEMDTLLNKFAPLLNIKPDRTHIQHFLNLAKLPKLIKKEVPELLEPFLGLALDKWKTQEQKFFISLISKLQLGQNKKKKLFSVLDELRATKRIADDYPDHQQTEPIHSIWKESGADKVYGDQRLGPSERFAGIMDRLQRLRFPLLSNHEKQFSELKAALKLPSHVQFHHPPYFEGQRMEVTFSFGRAQELLDTSTKLQETAQRDELKKILELL